MREKKPKRRKVIDRTLRVRAEDHPYPDFSALRRQIFSVKKTQKTGTDVVSEERSRY